MTCLACEAEPGSFRKKVVHPGGGELGEGLGAAAQFAVGARVKGVVESVVEELKRNDHAGNLAIVTAAGEMRAVSRLENDVEDDLAKVGILGVSVQFPVAGVGIELKGAGELLVIQFNRGVQEVRTGGVIPLAELHDANGLTRGGGKLPPERSAEPERLQFHLRRKPRPVLRDQSRRSVNIVAQGSVGHQVLSLEKTGEVIKS